MKQQSVFLSFTLTFCCINNYLEPYSTTKTTTMLHIFRHWSASNIPRHPRISPDPLESVPETKTNLQYNNTLLVVTPKHTLCSLWLRPNLTAPCWLKSDRQIEKLTCPSILSNLSKINLLVGGAASLGNLFLAEGAAEIFRWWFGGEWSDKPADQGAEWWGAVHGSGRRAQDSFTSCSKLLESWRHSSSVQLPTLTQTSYEEKHTYTHTVTHKPPLRCW